MSNSVIEGSFTFYPVGQGCFYAGSIKVGEKQFVIVYDCGTLSNRDYLKDSIVEFKQQFSKIDLLIVSHFDEDHVNGIKTLLTEDIRCEKVIIPYYNPITRLALWSNSNGGSDYTNFISNPINYFLTTEEFDVGEVFIVDDDRTEFTDTDIKAPKPTTPENINLDESFEFELKKVEESDALRKKVYENEKEAFYDSNKVKYLSLPFQLTFTNSIWEFVFYLRFWSNTAAIKNFENGINKLIASNGYGDLTSLFDDNLRNTVRNLYKTYINRKINYSSLVVYHTPTLQNAFSSFNCRICDRITLLFNFGRPYCGNFGSNKSATLLTGDLYLKSKKDFNLFSQYFSIDHFNNCYILQVPHHGAASCWNPFPNCLNDINHYVINHGLGRSHPNSSVVINIYNNSTSKSIISNNEASKISYCVESW